MLGFVAELYDHLTYSYSIAEYKEKSSDKCNIFFMINITRQIRPNLSKFGPGPELDKIGLISPICRMEKMERVLRSTITEAFCRLLGFPCDACYVYLISFAATRYVDDSRTPVRVILCGAFCSCAIASALCSSNSFPTVKRQPSIIPPWPPLVFW